MNKGYATNFVGVIRDIVFDHKLVSFNKPTQFRGVGIGREGGTLDWLDSAGTDVVGGTISKGHVKLTTTTNKNSNTADGSSAPSASKPSFVGWNEDDDMMMSIPAENWDGANKACASAHHSLMTVSEVDAISFGDSRRLNSSYVQIDTQDNEFYDDFSINFHFRTWYPNGILFTLARHTNGGAFGKPVFVVALVNSRIVLRMKMSNLHYVELASSPEIKLNDGHWHYVIAGRKKLSLWLNVDLKDRKENNKPKRKLALKRGIQAYMGGLPEEVTNLFGGSSSSSHENELSTNFGGNGNNGVIFLPTQEGYKGCVKKFYLNDRLINFRTLKLTSGGYGSPGTLGTCFQEIEAGTYFPGERDSFAVYDETFNIGLKADISFEFRTTKQAGVLFTMSNGTISESPALAIELTVDGALVASADLGSRGGGLFRARKVLGSAYELCDGRWHSVKVHYTQNAISLKLDRSEVVYGFNEDKNGDSGLLPLPPYTSAPLYIGGLPEGAPSGALLSREPFHGCLRNVDVNEQRKDWLSDVQLFNDVQPNACPAPASARNYYL